MLVLDALLSPNTVGISTPNATAITVHKEAHTDAVLSTQLDIVEKMREIFSELTRAGKGRILLTVAGGWFLSIGVRYVYPSMIPFFRTAFDLDLMLAGFLLSALWYAYAAGQFPGGVLGDRIGEGNILFVSTALSTVAILIVAIAPNVWFVFLGTIMFGFASALYATTRFTIFTDIYSERSGTAVGLTMAGGSLGNTVLPPLAAFLAALITWRWGFGVLIPLFVGVTVAILIVVPGRTSNTSTNEAEQITWQSVQRLLGSVTGGGIPVVVAIHVALSFVSHGFLGFYPTYLNDVKGFSTQVAAILFGLYFAVGVVIQPLIGVLRDRFGTRWTLTIIASMFFIGLAGLQFGESVWYFVLLTVFLSHRNALGVVTNTHISSTLPADIKGSGLGLLRTIWQFTAAASPIFVGFLGSLGRLNYAFIILTLVAALTTLLTVFVPNE